MSENIKELLNEEIAAEIQAISSLNSGSEEKSKAIEDLAKLYRLRIEETKSELDAEDKRSRRTLESEANVRENEIKKSQLDEQIKADVQDEQYKRSQLDEQVKDRYFKLGIAAAELLIPLMFYGIWMRKGFKFEETGTYRSSPTILTVVASIGVIATTITAVQATPKAIKLLKEAELEKGENLTKLEIVRVAGPTYIPSVLLGVSTIACIFGANALNQKKQASLYRAYKVSVKTSKWKETTQKFMLNFLRYIFSIQDDLMNRTLQNGPTQEFTLFERGRVRPITSIQIRDRIIRHTKMEPWFQMVVTIVCAVVVSSGFWAYIQKKSEKKDVRTQMLIGLAHDRIIYLGMSYIERGWITQDEYENLHDYLYKPYEEMGGNGSAKKVMQEINKLPIHKSTYIQENQ